MVNTNNQANKQKIDIDIWDFIPKLRQSMKFILMWGGILAVLGGIYAYGKSKTYKAELVLSPELGNEEGGSLSSLANMVGLSIDMGGTSDAINIMIYPNVVNSKPFLMDLTDIPVHTASSVDTISLRNYYKNFNGTLVEKVRAGFNKMISSIVPQKQIADAGENSGNKTYLSLSKAESSLIDKIGGSISVDVDNKTGIIIISCTTTDPVVSAIMTDTVCRRLQKYITEYKTCKANQDYKYYSKVSEEAEQRYKKALNTYANYVDSHQSSKLQSIKGEQEKLETEVGVSSQIYAQIEQKKEIARAKVQEVKPAFIVIDPAVVPIKATGIGRVLTIILSFFMGIILSSVWVFTGRDILKKLKDTSKK